MDQIIIKVWDKEACGYVDSLPIDAILSNGKAFGLHKRVYPEGSSKKSGWTITHLKTGAKLVHIRGKDVGLEIMAKLAPFEAVLKDVAPYSGHSFAATSSALKSIHDLLMPYIKEGKAYT